MSSIPNLVRNGDEGTKKHPRRESYTVGAGGLLGPPSTHASSSSGGTDLSSRRGSRKSVSSNEWSYASLDNGVFERALAHDQIMRKDLRRQKPDGESTRVQSQPMDKDRAPKDKDAKAKKVKPKGLGIFRRRPSLAATETEESSAPSLSSPSDFSLSSFPSSGISRGSTDDSYDARSYQYSMASTDDTRSVAFSNFTAPSWLGHVEDDESQRSSSSHSFASTVGHRRARSQSPSSTGSSLRRETSRTDSNY